MAGTGTVSILKDEVLVDATKKPNGAIVHEDIGVPQNGVPRDPIKCDVIVVGCGFSGITAIDRFRKAGMNVKCFESGSEIGGVWHWNRYPGARVDSEAPFYQLNIPEVYRDWHFSQRFPDHVELRRYLAHVDEVLDLKRDVYLNARVSGCTWDDNKHEWTIKTLQGHIAVGKYLIACSGLLHRTYTPKFAGLADFKGELCHSGAWPENFSARGKKVAIIGAGATAVQITQELGKDADELTVFLRRGSHCLPLGQREWTKQEQDMWKAYYPTLFKAGRDSAGGFPAESRPERVQDLSKEEREAYWESLWPRGGFQFLLGNFSNIVTDREASRLTYDFWRKKVCERLTDPEKQKIMAPEEPLFHFSTKRSPLEVDYYDVLNQTNVRIHDLRHNPMKSFSATGITTSDDINHPFDTVILATGFDSYTGSLTQMGLKSKSGEDLRDEWVDGVHTYLGLAVAGFPNFFMSYAPQSPAAYGNGPSMIETAVESIVAIVTKTEKEKVETIEASPAAEAEWRATVDGIADYLLISETDSWWNAANVEGKTKQTLTYFGGLNAWEKQIRESMDSWKGWELSSAKA